MLSACTPHAAALVVNEVTSEGIDMIELYNGTAATIALLGYQVLDSADHTFTFGARSISAGGYVVLEKDVDFTFGLASDDLVKLLDKNGNVVDVADWAAGEAAPSYCRSPNGTGGFHTCATASFGSANP
ncbi:MAG: lamin tail domain-containing protein [Myxococcota bacterium]